MYGVTSIYFAGVMVRLMLVLAPIMCILGGVAVNGILTAFMKNLEGVGVDAKPKETTQKTKENVPKNVKKEKSDNYPYKNEVKEIVLIS